MHPSIYPYHEADSGSGSDGMAIVSFTAATAITDYWNSSVSFCNTALLLISDFSLTPLAKLKEARYNMTKQTKTVIFKEARAWLLPITRPSSSARRC